MILILSKLIIVVKFRFFNSWTIGLLQFTSVLFVFSCGLFPSLVIIVILSCIFYEIKGYFFSFSLYLRNVRLGSEYAGLDFWLSSISCHAPGAPIFVVGTHIDEVNFSINDYFISSYKLKVASKRPHFEVHKC